MSDEPHAERPALPRRCVLKSIALTSAAAALGAASLESAGAQNGSPQRREGEEGASIAGGANPVVVENRREGTADWLLRNPVVSPPHKLWHMYGLRSKSVEGYCSRPSVRAGQTLEVKVSADPPGPVTLEVFRMGYYGGLGGRQVMTIGPVEAATQPTPEPGVNRVAACDWRATFSFTIPADWLSGVYLGRLTEGRAGRDSYVVFIVRDDRAAHALFQCSDMTWQAYNRWPYNNSLYCTEEIDWHTGSGVDVSLDRPYGKYTQMVDQPLAVGSGEFLLWEYPLVYFLEMHGYDISYISNWDTHVDSPERLRRARGFLSVGHDEYWTQPMVDHLKGAIGEGLNVAFLSANSVFCKCRLKPDPWSGRAERVFERDGRFSPREKTLIGAMSTPPVIGGGDWTCVRPEHWVFEGTGMKKGDSVKNLVGWEFHGDPAEIEGLEILAEGPTDSRRFPATEPASENDPGRYTATIYPGPAGNFVFNAATIWWADALAAPPGYKPSDWYGKRAGVDARVQRITRNLLDRMRG